MIMSISVEIWPDVSVLNGIKVMADPMYSEEDLLLVEDLVGFGILVYGVCIN